MGQFVDDDIRDLPRSPWRRSTPPSSPRTMSTSASSGSTSSTATSTSVVVAVDRSDPASVTQTKQPSVPGVLAFLVHGFIAQVKMPAFYITYYICIKKHVEVDLCMGIICSLHKDANDRSSTQALLTTYLVSRFFMALTLKDQSILVNGDINEGLLRLCHKLHRLRKEYAYTFESTTLSYQCSEVTRILQGYKVVHDI
ncbi:hypothetical protein Zm00014a_040821 [Zea mays]|uniref:Uncharacterized protein n=1 Tax=Zea mays TaxID=4577 RepID=A0A3L6EC83_MAIZE|nr:hypothetical protein Zm00014a_040821 [Zea mays]